MLEEKQLYVSFVTQLETLVYKGISKLEIHKIKSFLNECVIIDINAVIKDFAIKLKQEYSLKLPDSLIMATSLYLNSPVITADHEFQKVEEIDLILYE